MYYKCDYVVYNTYVYFKLILNIMELILKIFNSPIFTLWWWITTLIVLFWILVRIILRIFNISPIVFRLWNALLKRNVAIFWSDSAFDELKEILTESSIFKTNKIVHIRKSNLEKAKDFSLYLIDWESNEIDIDKIISLRKNHHVWIVVFAKPRSIDVKNMDMLTNCANTIIVNARWRLINDMFTLLITTKYGG